MCVDTCPWALWLSLAELPREGGRSFPVFVYFSPNGALCGSPIAPVLALWLSLSWAPRGGRGRGGAFLLCVRLFLIYLSIICHDLPLGWCSVSRSLSSQGGGPSFSVFFYFRLICPLFRSKLAPGLALWLSLAELPRGGGSFCVFVYL